MACRDGRSVQLFTRRGYDWTNRFQLIADAVASLRCRSCFLDGEPVVCGDRGIPDFTLLIGKRRYASAQLYAFDLLELDGQDLRTEPIERRKRALAKMLGKDRAGLLISQPIDTAAHIAFQHICRLSLVRRHRIQAARLELRMRPFLRLAEDYQPECASLAAARARKLVRLTG